MPPESLPFLENLRRGATWVRTIFNGFVRVVAIANADIVALSSVEIVDTWVRSALREPSRMEVYLSLGKVSSELEC